MDNRGNSRANTCEKSRLALKKLEGMYLLDKKPMGGGVSASSPKKIYFFFLVIHNNSFCFESYDFYVDDGSFKFLPYQLSMVM